MSDWANFFFKIKGVKIPLGQKIFVGVNFEENSFSRRNFLQIAPN